MTEKCRKPCDNCPWRRDAPRNYWDPQHFIDIWNRCQGDGMNMMLCHKSSALPEEKRGSLICQGWIRVMGFESIGVRIASMKGYITVEETEDLEGHDLFKTFAEMLRANRIKIPRVPRYEPTRKRR